MIERNFGILASIDWNSRKWRNLPVSEDLKTSNYGYVKDNGYTHTCLNFGHEIYPPDEKGYYHGLLPQLWSRMPDATRARYVDIVFMKSQYWKDKQNYIVFVFKLKLLINTGVCNHKSRKFYVSWNQR